MCCHIGVLGAYRSRPCSAAGSPGQPLWLKALGVCVGVAGVYAFMRKYNLRLEITPRQSATDEEEEWETESEDEDGEYADEVSAWPPMRR